MSMVSDVSISVKSGTTPLPYTGSSVAPVVQAASNMKDCDECKQHETTAQATGFCVHCKLFLCAQCNFNHQTNEWTKQHIILHGVEMPKDSCQEYADDFCDLHPKHSMDLYCPVHTEAFCPECKESRHSRCRKVTPIAEAAKHVNLVKDLPRAVQDVRRLIMQFEKLKSQKTRQIDSLNGDLMECLSSVGSLKIQITRILDRLEERIQSMVTQRITKEIKERVEIQDRCNEKIARLKEEANNLDRNKKAEDAKCFISILRANGVHSDCDAVLTDLQRGRGDLRFQFEANYKLMHFLKELNSLGQLKSSIARPQSSSLFSSSGTLAPTPTTDIPTSMMSELKNKREFVLCGEHNITSTNDAKNTCFINGSTFLPDGRLLLCDNRNHSVKLLDQSLKLRSVYKMSHPPFDVAYLTNREAVVTLPEKRELHFLIMDPDLRAKRIVSTDTGCHGIRLHKDGLLTANYNQGVFGVVRLLNMSGGIKQTFDRDHEGNPLFQGPSRLAINQKHDRFYVSDKNTNTVVGMSMGGKVVFRYRSNELQGPGNICIDKEGAIYVCGRDSNTIHVIKTDGRKSRLISLEEDICISTVSYRASDGVFVVGSARSDKIRTYKLV